MMKTFTSRALSLVAAALVIVPAATAAESLSVLLQKAIYAEETEGNLDGAIKLYEQITSEGATNRALIAQAQYRLAICYQKQGKTEQAIKLLNDLVQQSPADADLRKKAQTTLTELGIAPSEAVMLRKLAVVNNSWIRAVSSDGKYIAHTGTDGDVLLHEPATRRTWIVVKSNWDTTPWCIVFSPDGRSIAYELGGELRGKSLIVASVDGSDAREIYKAEENATIYPHRWIPGTDDILCMLEEKNPRARKAVVINSKSRALRHSCVLPSTNDSYWSASSGGRYFAMRDGSRLSLIDVESGHQETIVEDNVTRSNIGWAHDDSVLFFTSDRTGARGLWMIQIQAGKANGEPTMVKELGTEAEFVDATPDGQIYYAEDNNTASVCVVTANLENGERQTEPRLVTDRFPGRQTTPVWSSDGRKLWLASQGEQRRYIAVSMNTGKQEDFALAHNFTGRLWDYSLAIDGSFLLIEGRRTNKPGASVYTLGIHRYETATGKIETLLPSKTGNTVRRPRVSPDGKSFYYAREFRDQLTTGADNPQKRRILIVRRDLLSGNEEVIRESTGPRIIWRFGAEISPDGSRLAYVTTDEHLTRDFVSALEILDLRTGQTREIRRTVARGYISSIAWTPDGKRLVYSTWTPATGPAEGSQSANSSGLRAYPKPNAADDGETAIWSQAVDSGQPVKLKLALPDLGDVAVGPDGQVAFRTGTIGDMAQIWVMEGVRPQPAPANAPKRPSKAIGRAANSTQPVEPKDISGPNNSIIDRVDGVTAILPTGWSISQGTRFGDDTFVLHPEGFTGLSFIVPDSQVVARLAYHSFDASRPLNASEVTTWLQLWPTRVADADAQRLGDVQNRDVIARTIGDAVAQSWSSDFVRGGEKWTREAIVLRNENGYAYTFVFGPVMEMDAVRPAFARFVETLRIEKRENRSATAMPRMIVPVADVSGTDHAVFDPITGLGAQLPSGWTVDHADRVFEYLADMDLPVRIECTAPEHPDAMLSLIFCLNRDPTPSSGNVNSWLKSWVETEICSMRSTNPYVSNFQLQPVSFAFRSINEHPALTWTSDVVTRGERTKEYSTLIYSEQGIGYVRISAPTRDIEALRSTYEKFVETVRVP